MYETRIIPGAEESVYLAVDGIPKSALITSVFERRSDSAQR